MITFIISTIFSLLAQNKVSEFHTEIERLEPSEIHSDIYIKHPIQVEQYLMEGNYNKVSIHGLKISHHTGLSNSSTE